MFFGQRRRWPLALLSALMALFPSVAVAGDDWLPISPEELSMTAEPKAPGAPAIFLYRQVDSDDGRGIQDVYARIKILTPEGRKYADVELPFLKDYGDIKNVRARTIRPNGAIENFDGKIYEDTIVKARGVKMNAKTFSLPNVEPGTIIEYRYQETGYYADSRWILSGDLFTRHAKFTLRHSGFSALRIVWPTGLPAGATPPTKKDNLVSMEIHDVPAFQVEDYMPPEGELEYRVDFIYYPYALEAERDQNKFWKQMGKYLFEDVDKFTDKRKAMEQAVGQIIAPGDSQEAMLRKIYDRAQQINNLSYAPEKTENELKRDKTKDAKNVEDIWKRGEGDADNIPWLFLALARAAGFKADPVLLSSRDRYFFSPRAMDPYRLNASAVIVNLKGKDLYFDPGNPYAPFAMLPWYETGVQGLRLDKDGGTFVTSPIPAPSDSQVQRNADLHLDADTGALEGKVTVIYTGLEALDRRRSERNEDDTGRKKLLEDELEAAIPVGYEAQLNSRPDWKGSETPLTAEFTLKVPGWVSAAGRRALISSGLFGNDEKTVFTHASRVHPIYFHFPYQHVDNVSITLPAAWRVSNLPAPLNDDAKLFIYSTSAENKNGTLTLHRQLTSNALLLDTSNYPPLRHFFDQVRTGDDQQIVLLPQAQAAQK